MNQSYDKQYNLIESSSTYWKTFNDSKPLSEDRIEIPATNSDVRFFISVLRPRFADKVFIYQSNRETSKEVQSQESPLQHISDRHKKSKSFSGTDKTINIGTNDIRNNNYAKRKTLIPFVKEQIFRKQRTMIRPPTRKESPIVKNEISSRTQSFSPSDQCNVFLKKVQSIVHSKKLCQTQNKLFTDYQNLINYIP
ncbi:hypothetical protein SteCoe_28472 [Stentor coeruleus]|uniref:Uncharacterized protein n=1 Tax=Stentor coeruleus TaxID=5963 RepID=A0A1R2B853_9CILI|nr:hypothetical protein SteCoe_28472 [Stentor coeruleus]